MDNEEIWKIRTIFGTVGTICPVIILQKKVKTGFRWRLGVREWIMCVMVVVVLVTVVLRVESSSSKLSFFGFSSHCLQIIYSESYSSPLILCARKQNKLKHFQITTDVLKTKQHRRSFTNWLLLLIKACLQECIYFGVLSKCMTSCFNPHLYCFISPIQWS